MAKRKPGPKNNQNRNLFLVLIPSIVIVFLLIIWSILKASKTTDTWCMTSHTTDLAIVESPKTATDFYNNGNYQFSVGDCAAAITDYSKAIQLKPTAESYNNRAYTYMRMGEYTNALPDLDKAIALRPDYVNAIMNRGDVYNFYQMNRSLALNDYQKVVSLGGANQTSVCGHMILARDNGWNIKTFVDLISAFVTHLGNLNNAGC